MEIDIDALDSADAANEDAKESAKDIAAHSRLNSWVAITVALLATFLGVCKVKDDNIVQAMQQAQASKLDDWSFYQARNIRQEIAQATATQLTVTRLTAPAAQRPAIDSAIAQYKALVKDQATKKDSLRVAAEGDQKTYDALNYRDDQFDLSDALIALAISLLALTALTKKRWLFWAALVPTALGVLMGLAGLLGWSIHPTALTNLLS